MLIAEKYTTVDSLFEYMKEHNVEFNYSTEQDDDEIEIKHVDIYVTKERCIYLFIHGCIVNYVIHDEEDDSHAFIEVSVADVIYMIRNLNQ